MLILAIDTTGFSSSLALVRDGKEVLRNTISSGFLPKKSWTEFIRILPECHLNFLKKELKRISWDEVDAIAVSAQSGIHSCILVGRSVAQTLSFCYNKPLIEVDHILAHVYSPWLERDVSEFKFPILVFSASGSHSDFSFLKSESEYELLCDEVGRQKMGDVEVFVGFGKVFYQAGKILGLVTSSESGPEKFISAAKKGSVGKFDFSSFYKGNVFDLNFIDFLGNFEKFVKGKKNLSLKAKQDIAAGFQETVSNIIVGKIAEIAKFKKVSEIHIAGGVSENVVLRKKIKEALGDSFVFRYPAKKNYRLDNAAMIGALAYFKKKYKISFKGFNPQITYGG